MTYTDVPTGGGCAPMTNLAPLGQNEAAHQGWKERDRTAQQRQQQANDLKALEASQAAYQEVGKKCDSQELTRLIGGDMSTASERALCSRDIEPPPGEAELLAGAKDLDPQHAPVEADVDADLLRDVDRPLDGSQAALRELDGHGVDRGIVLNLHGAFARLGFARVDRSATA